MGHAETLERRICPRCKNFGAGYASDSDVCPICGADTVVVPAARVEPPRADAFIPPPKFEPEPDFEPQPPLPSVGAHRRLRDAALPFAAGILATGSLVAVFHYAGQPQKPEPEERASDAGSVVAVTPRVAPKPTPAPAPAPAPVAKIEPPPVDTTARSDAVMPAQPPAAAVAVAPKPEAPPPVKNAMSAQEKSIFDSARTALRKSDVTEARAQLRRLPANAQSQGEFRQLSNELTRRERERDAALQRAHWCEEGKDWTCMAQNAARAQSIDTGNAESHVMLSLATTRLRWATVSNSASAAPVRTTPPMPPILKPVQ